MDAQVQPLAAAGAGFGFDLNLAGDHVSNWNFNAWSWDSDRLLATPVTGYCSNISSSCSEDVAVVMNDNLSAASDKRKRVFHRDVIETPGADDSQLLTVLGGGSAALVYGDEKSTKRGKVQAGNSGNLICQVGGCKADLSGAKEYHRRHKVCERHAKAASATVRSGLQRFCQQCSRFHLLEEFDEGRRSCRRRLAGHNKRRRKPLPEAAVCGNSLVGDGASSFALMNLVKVFDSMQSDNSDHKRERDIVNNLLRGLATLAGSLDATAIYKLLQEYRNMQKNGTNVGTSLGAASVPSFVAPGSLGLTNSKTLSSNVTCVSDILAGIPSDHLQCTTNILSTSIAETAAPCKAQIRNFDLNDTYIDLDDPQNENGSVSFPTCETNASQSPQQESGSVDSISTQSLSSASGDSQCRTDRMIIKLFNKEPSELPLDLRSQILSWLNNSPTDMESYIRPGCVILTLYLHLVESNWAELGRNLHGHLSKLVNSSTDNFWNSGWVFAMMQNHLALIYNGQVLLNKSLSFQPHEKILLIQPVAVPHSAQATFIVRGYNLVSPSSRVLCSYDGNYLFNQNTSSPVCPSEHEELQSISFSCSIPSCIGRGFIEIEDQGYSNGFFPFIIADQEICSEICNLENVLEPTLNCHGCLSNNAARNEALEFLNELGWLLRRANMISRAKELQPFPEVFHLSRFLRLLSFAMEHDWCAVVEKLLDILFCGVVELVEKSPLEVARSENLLHAAVQRNCAKMVKFLLRYKLDDKLCGANANPLVFNPDATNSSKRTPLHTAATSIGAEDVLDALTSDPRMVSLSAWRNARDIDGFTPEDYARRQGHKCYLELVQRKIDLQAQDGYVVIGISEEDSTLIPQTEMPATSCFRMSKSSASECTMCSQQVAYRRSAACRTIAAHSFLYRPALFTMVAIATVCVCLGLLLRTAPRVCYVSPSFRWELLANGPI